GFLQDVLDQLGVGRLEVLALLRVDDELGRHWLVRVVRHVGRRYLVAAEDRRLFFTVELLDLALRGGVHDIAKRLKGEGVVRPPSRLSAFGRVGHCFSWSESQSSGMSVFLSVPSPSIGTRNG